MQSLKINYVNVQTAQADHAPIIFSLRYNLHNDGWKLPYIDNQPAANVYKKLLCPLLEDDATSDVSISVSSSSVQSLQFSLTVQHFSDFQISLNQPVSVAPISSFSPLFYYVDINSEEDPKKTGILEVLHKFLNSNLHLNHRLMLSQEKKIFVLWYLFNPSLVPYLKSLVASAT